MTLKERIVELGLKEDEPITAVGVGQIISAPIRYFLNVRSLLNSRIVKEEIDKSDGRHIFTIV